MAMLFGGLAPFAPADDTPTESASAALFGDVPLQQGRAPSSGKVRGGRSASTQGKLIQEQSSGSQKEIAFKWPIDFATGAIPSSAAFNVAYGEGPLPVTRATPLTDSVAVGDFNHDGKPDVAQTNVIAGTVSVFIGKGNTGFEPPQQHPVGANPVFVVAGDLDLDGNLDLVVANYASNDVAILGGDGKGSFQPAFFVPVPTPRNVAIGEFNGDGIPDLAVASLGRAAGPESLPTGGVTILTGSKGGSFIPAQFISPTLKGRPVAANYVSAGDFNGSGFDDLAVGLGNSNSAGDPQASDNQLTGDDVVIYLNRDRPIGLTPELPFSTTEQQRIRVGSLPNAISVADLNSDTHPDLAVLGATSGDVTTLLGDSEGHFVVKATNVTVGAMPFALAAGDFNDDTVLDLVTANWMSSTVSVLQGEGDGRFEPALDFWSGDATSSAAVGDFNDDGLLDIVAARLRNDHLALFVNESPKRGDGVVIKRDIPYGSITHPTNDPFAAHHTLDVYTPPPGTASFAGKGRPYPVVLFAHGGGGITGDKSLVSYLMRSLALKGLVGVSIDYRLSLPADGKAQTQDVVQAFRWVRDNVASTEYRGDPNNIFVSGTSAGGALMTQLATKEGYRAEQKNVRGLVLVSAGDMLTHPSAEQPPSLLLNGNQGGELISIHHSVVFSQRSSAPPIGKESTHVIVPGRDHVTLLSNLAMTDDLGRVHILDFMRRHIALG
jgi:acetyl esterase/lipase